MATRKSLIGIPLLLVLLLLSGCEHGAATATLIWDGAHIYDEGDTVPGQLILLQGQVVAGEGSEVAGTVYMLGGDLTVAGTVAEDIAIIGGNLELGPTAVVNGDVSVGGGTFEQSPQATVRGQVLGGSDVALSPETIFPRQTAGERLLRMVPEALIVAILAHLAVRFVGGAVGRVSRATARHPIVSGAMGLLVGVVGPSLLVLMAFTVILIPVTFLALLLTALVVLYAWIGLGMALGGWLNRRLERDWPAPRAAFVGAFLFVVVTTLLELIPLVGAWVGILATAVGLGAVFLTRFGLREFAPTYEFGPPG